MKLGTFFSGIGATEKALKNIGVEYDLQFFSEVDKYAIKSYVEIHNEPTTKNVGDITKLKGKDLPYCDMWFGGFPCQDISVAGNLAGWESNTRSSLGWEMIRLAREVEQKPKYIIFENVKNITSKRFKDTLRLFKSDLEELGYYLYDDVLNAKDYGIPQNRERYFLIATLEKINYEFPKPEELKLKLKDMLEDKVEEKYYLSDKMIKYISATGTANYLSDDLPDNYDLNGSSYLRNFGSKGKLQDKEYCDTLTASMGTGGGNVPILRIKNNTKLGYKEAYDGDGINISSRMEYQRGNVQKESIQTITTSGGSDRGVVVIGGIGEKKSNNGTQWYQQDRIYDNKIGLSISTTAMPNYLDNQLRIRKLTPKECWRLMGFDDVDFDKASKVNSNTQLYKQAGNSIVVDVLEKIFKELFRK